MTESNLINTEKQITLLANRIEQVEHSNWFVKLLRLKKLKAKLKELDQQQFYSIGEYLYVANKEYQKIADENQKMLAAHEIEFLVYDHNVSYGSYIKSFEGAIHSNGCSYTYAQNKTGFLITDNNVFPTELTGTIDYWGIIKLQTSKRNFAFFKNVPKKFKGVISLNGSVKMVNVKNEYDFTGKGQLTIGKIIARHFENDPYASEIFFKNKEVLSEMVLTFRKKMIEKQTNL